MLEGFYEVGDVVGHGSEHFLAPFFGCLGGGIRADPAVVAVIVGFAGDGDGAAFEGDVVEADGGEGVADVVFQELGLGDLVHVDVIGIYGHDTGGFFGAAVAALPGWIKFTGDEPPVDEGQERAFFVKSEAYGFDGFDVAAVTVENDEFPDAVAVQGVSDAGKDQGESVKAQGNGAGEAHELVGGSVGKGGSDENVCFLLHQLQDFVGNEHVRSQGHVAAVAFDAADGDNGHVMVRTFF